MNTIKALKEKLSELCPKMELLENESMAKHTTFRIGGTASLMAVPRTKEEAILAVQTAAEMGINPFFLGRGSNVLVADQHQDIFVVKFVGMSCQRHQEKNCMIVADAGVSLSQVSMFAMEKSLGGLEFAQGIPGTLGGAVFMNAGAYDGEMSQVVTGVTAISKEGVLHEFHGEDFDFTYRHSVFSSEEWLILGVTLKLIHSKREIIQMTMSELMLRRRDKQPLEFPNGGSTFKRPEGHFAGKLIEECGLKGYRVGDAEVSEKHAGFIINRGSATCEDVLAVMRHVQAVVKEKMGITLEPELRMLGCEL